MYLRCFTSVLLIFIASTIGCSQTKQAELTDQYILEYASTDFDVNVFNREDPKTVLGFHNGIKVVVEYMCSDLCPNNTVRIIHYEISDDQSCATIGGVEHKQNVPYGIALMPMAFCYPPVLVEHWDVYKKYAH